MVIFHNYTFFKIYRYERNIVFIMLETVILSFAISPLEANFILTHLHDDSSYDDTPTGKKTTFYKDYGILDLNIWMNFAAIKTEPFTNRNCLINATINYIKAYECFNSMRQISKFSNCKNVYDFLSIKLNEIIPKSIFVPNIDQYGFNRELEWKVKSANFTYNFIGTEIVQYYKLLSGGYNLPKFKLEKNVSIIRPPKTTKKDSKDSTVGIKYITEYSGKRNPNTDTAKVTYHEAFHITIELDKQSDDSKINQCDDCIKYVKYQTSRNRLQLKFSVRRNKMIQLCNDYGIAERNFGNFITHIDEIDRDIFTKYVTYITGKGKFYCFRNAEDIIYSSKIFTSLQRNRMVDVLKNVANYKSISNYLDHVEDELLTYETMASVRKRTYALRLLQDIQSLGICPLNLPVRYKYKELDNLITVYEEANSDTLTK